MHELIENFLHKYLKGVNSNRINQYLNVLNKYFEWANVKSFEDYKTINRDDINHYKKINNFKSDDNRVKGLVVTINNINKNLYDSGLIENYFRIKGVVTDTKINKSQRVEGVKFNLNEKIQSERILEILQDASKIDYDNRVKEPMIARNILIIKFIYIFSLQSIELIKLKWSSLYKKDNKYYLNIKTGRGDSEIDICEIKNESLIEQINNFRDLLVKNNIKLDFIFCSLSYRTMGRSMSTKGVNDIIVRLSKGRGKSFSSLNIRNLSNGHLFTHEYINTELKPSLRDKYFKCRSCTELIKWRNDKLCDECSTLGKKDYINSGYVYFIRTIDYDYTKIGIAHKNVSQRLKTNQVGNMYELYLMGYLQSPDFKNMEQEIQSKLGKKHMRGEWFNVKKKEVIEVIKELGYIDTFTEVNQKDEG
jgi:site-specific recombinase XerD